VQMTRLCIVTTHMARCRTIAHGPAALTHSEFHGDIMHGVHLLQLCACYRGYSAARLISCCSCRTHFCSTSRHRLFSSGPGLNARLRGSML
jgi:hypothetical protein